MRIINTNYKIKGTINAKIVLISDLHYYCKSDIKLLIKVLKRINKIRPDYICIPGDIVDEYHIKDEKCFINWLNNLSKIAKVIISIGNHEFYYNKSKKIFKLNINLKYKISKISNLYLLDNKNIVLDNINFIGLTLPIEYYNSSNKNNILGKYLKNIKVSNNHYNVLLCHSPIDISKKDALKNLNIDLVLCGHTHGGITPRFLRPIIGNSGLISVDMHLFPKNVYGHLKVCNSNIIITSGIRVISHINKFRILKDFFSSEIVIIEIN